MFKVKPPHKGAWFSTELLLIKKAAEKSKPKKRRKTKIAKKTKEEKQ